MNNKYLKLNAIPMCGKMLMPVLKNYENILDVNDEYLDVRVYKDKYVLDHFEVNDNKIEVFSFNKNKIYIIKEMYGIGKDENVSKLCNLYDNDLVIKIVGELIEISKMEYNSHDSYEDYDFDECLHILFKKMLDKYSSEIEIIYILTSYMYPQYIEIYYDIYKEVIRNR